MLSPRMIPMSVIPASCRSSTQYRTFGLFTSGRSCLGPVWVRGRRCVPWPPVKTTPFIRCPSCPPALRGRSGTSYQGIAPPCRHRGTSRTGAAPSEVRGRWDEQGLRMRREAVPLSREFRAAVHVERLRPPPFVERPSTAVEDVVRREEAQPDAERVARLRDFPRGVGVDELRLIRMGLARVHARYRRGQEDRLRMSVADERDRRDEVAQVQRDEAVHRVARVRADRIEPAAFRLSEEMLPEEAARADHEDISHVRRIAARG